MCACATALWSCATPLCAAPLAALAAPVLPTAAQVTAGAATVRSSGTSMTITQSTPDVAINWRSFSIGAGDAVRFIQPGASSIVLNRVLGQDPSQILGMLAANGQVFILNPDGVLFGRNAEVSVGGLVASTLGLSDLDLSAGRLTLRADSASGSVVNQGAIATATGGYVALIAPQVRNEGSIHAHAGNVALLGASDITLTLGSGNLFGVAVASDTINGLIDSRSAFRTGGRIVLSAGAMDQVSRAAVNSLGLVEAGALATRDGVIRLQASEVINSGGIDASSGHGSDDSRGGLVAISADRVALTSTSVIDASGVTGGGLIEIGGGLQGGPEVLPKVRQRTE